MVIKRKVQQTVDIYKQEVVYYFTSHYFPKMDINYIQKVSGSAMRDFDLRHIITNCYNIIYNQ